MIEPAGRRTTQDVDAERDTRQPDADAEEASRVSGGGVEGSQALTAEAFRSLAARLKSDSLESDPEAASPESGKEVPSPESEPDIGTLIADVALAGAEPAPEASEEAWLAMLAELDGEHAPEAEPAWEEPARLGDEQPGGAPSPNPYVALGEVRQPADSDPLETDPFSASLALPCEDDVQPPEEAAAGEPPAGQDPIPLPADAPASPLAVESDGDGAACVAAMPHPEGAYGEDVGPGLSIAEGAPAVETAAPERLEESPFAETGLRADALTGDPAPEPKTAETARLLLDIMSMPSGGAQPQERALAADTLLRLVGRTPVDSLLALGERLCMMEAPPPLLVKRLIEHESEEVASALLEKCASIRDQDLLGLAETAGIHRLCMIARRRHLSSALADALIRRGDGSVLLTLIRNPGAVLSHEAFIELCEKARALPTLQAPLVTRPDTPAPVAFELFWFLPSELRRYVISRFLTNSAILERILKIAQSLDATPQVEGGSRFSTRLQQDELIDLIEAGLTPEASRRLAALAGICEANARRIVTDPEGEPLIVALKAVGMSRAKFAAAAERWRLSPMAALRPERNIGELQIMFDSLSFNKARVLLTYWDWAARRSGPYAREAA